MVPGIDSASRRPGWLGIPISDSRHKLACQQTGTCLLRETSGVLVLLVEVEILWPEKTVCASLFTGQSLRPWLATAVRLLPWLATAVPLFLT